MSDNSMPADHRAASPDRRDLLRSASMLLTGVALGQGGVANAQQAADSSPEDSNRADQRPVIARAAPFPGFTSHDIQTSGGAKIHAVKGGKGPPVLLLHGAPLTYYTWHAVAPQLARDYTVVAADLRGYGDSDKPKGLADHTNYAKRAMALDQIEVMRHFGYERFALVGQDRGGRVGHRMALDHPDAVTRAVFIDIVPTHYLYTHVTIEFVQAYYHWFSYLREAPIPENELLAQRAARAGRQMTPVQMEYQRTNGTPEGVHGMCEDYRAGASIDLQHDAADLSSKIRCPLHILWAEGGAMDRIYDVLPIWRPRGANVTGKPMPGGHNMQEGAPQELIRELQTFLRA
jgi:haloacetate dehalogenase